jgi:flavin-dependent dehydrogenase
VHWAGRTQAYVTPVGRNEVGVAFVSADPAVRADDCLSLFPVLQKRLAGAAVIGRGQGGTSITLRVPCVVRSHGSQGVALIGEASGCVDAITGEGMTLLFRQALALGAALRTGDLEPYQQEHRRILRRARFMSRMLLLLSEHPRWRSQVFRGFAAQPRVFESLLGMHIGEWPRFFGAGQETRLLSGSH